MALDLASGKGPLVGNRQEKSSWARKPAQQHRELPEEAIDLSKFDIGLTAGPAQDHSIGSVKRFFTRHRRSVIGQEIEIRHALLPFPQSA